MNQNPSLPPWHSLSPSDVLSRLDAKPGGLLSSEARRRLEQNGPNTLPRKPPPPGWVIFLRQFKSPLIYILGVAAAISLGLGHTTDAGFIVGVLLINAVIGGLQELKAERSAEALQKLLKIKAVVERDGDAAEVDAEDVVPGDVVWLESGNRVPADLRLLSTSSLEVDESLLTGESLAVHKDAGWKGKDETVLGDRMNMAFAGAIIVRGRGKGVVVETGSHTAVGRLALAVMTASSGRPPLLLRMERFSRAVALAVLGAAGLVALIGVLFRGYTWTDMFLFGVALAVSAIPEGLPVALSVALAIGTNRMAARRVIVRRLAAVEGLGSCTFIASDKTGTLTCNELTVKEIRLPDNTVFQTSGVGFAPKGKIESAGRPVEMKDHKGLRRLAAAAVLANEGELHRKDGDWVWRGDPTDVALLTLGEKAGLTRVSLIDRFPEAGRIPFEPERKYSASFHMIENQPRAIVKGAPERVIDMCDVSDKKAALNIAHEMARKGYRVLALAEGDKPVDFHPEKAPSDPKNLTLLGFMGMIDPLREGVREAVAACRKAGVAVAMVTGDHPLTALSISKDLGLASDSDQLLTGADLLGKSERELEALCENVRVFARIEPDQKLQIVQTLQRLGHFVAVTGDGVNDAPALRAANIGVAMGKSGTDVAREASEIVLSDDNFSTLVGGVEEGRIAYDNIRKVIYLLVSTGFAEVVLVLLSVLFGTPLPLLPVQLLWLNLITNGIQDVALAFEPGEGGVLNRRPRPPKERVFNRLMIERTLVGALTIGGVGFLLFTGLLNAGWEEEAARNALLLLMVLFENVHIGNSRSETKSAFALSPFRNKFLLAGTLTAFSIHLLMMYLPFGQTLLRTQPVAGPIWALLLACALTVLLAMEIHKWVWVKVRRKK